MRAPASHPLLQPIRRWTALRKASVIDAIDAGRVRRDQIMRRHGISAEELELWRANLTVPA